MIQIRGAACWLFAGFALLGKRLLACELFEMEPVLEELVELVVEAEPELPELEAARNKCFSSYSET